MSIYRSEAVLKNASASSVSIGTITIAPGSSVTYWNTLNTVVSPAVLDNFHVLDLNKTALDLLVEAGTLVATQDGLDLSYLQFLYLFSQQRDAVQTSTSLEGFTLPTKTAPATPEGAPLVVPAPREGDEWVVGTHNFADPCTWFGDSVRVDAKVLTDSGDGLRFTSGDPSWVDMYSGRQHNDALWVYLQTMMDPGNPHGYAVVVQVDGVTKTARKPFATTGGDYEIIWESGEIIFFSSQAAKVVTASYSKSTTSVFYVRTRDPAKSLVIEDAESDISLDCIMNDEVVYAVWVFDPGSGTYGNVGEFSYHRTGQLVTEARGSYPAFEALGCTAAHKALPLPEFRRKSRGMKGPRQSLPFKYSTIRELPYGAEIRISLRDSIPCDGEHVSMTLYCTEKAV